MSLLSVTGTQLTYLTAYNEYLTDVIIAVIVYVSAFSLIIKMWLGGRQKKKEAASDAAVPNANAEPVQPAAADAEIAGEEKGKEE